VAATAASDHAALVGGAMRDPRTYPGAPRDVEVVETHCSWVFLAGERAYKVKKPVVLPFVDQGSLSRRRALCREEVRLNRRLAPRIYLRTVALVRAGNGFALVPDERSGVDAAIEIAVEMVRFADQDTLAWRVRANAVSDQDAERLGRLLAGFHLVARRSRDTDGAIRALAAAMRTTLDDLSAPVGGLDSARVAALRRFLTAFMAATTPELARRGSRGLVRDGHGDLRAEHVVMGDHVQVVDCLEFDPALRIGDVALDLSFLVMDLDALGAPRLARGVIDAYRRAGGDPGNDRLLAGLACFRALVRAKVATVRAGQVRDGANGFAAEAARLIDVAERLAWRARGPVVIVCCGPSASGKSTLAARLSRMSGLEHLSSDLVRKRLVGVAPTERAPIAAYTPEVTAATYDALAEGAARACASGRGAIVDATFRTVARRTMFLNVLGDRGAPVLFAECRAPAAVLERRADERARDPARVSDATVDVVRAHLASWEAFAGAGERRHLVVPADQSPQGMADAVLAWLDRRLETSR
jgi:aminoglycoside phosphotransferase family enzyme/predicted kinase